MEITLPVHELKTVLTGLGKIINKSSHLPVLRALKVTCNASGMVTFHASDLDTHVVYRSDTPQPGFEGTFLMPFEPVLKWIRTLPPQENILLTQHDKEDICLACPVAGQSIEQRFETLPVEEFPAMPSVKGEPLVLDDHAKEVLLEALECASDTSRPILSGACLDTHETGSHYMVATDGKHLFAANSFTFNLKQPLIVPHRKILAWNVLFEDGDWRMSLEPRKDNTGGWLQLASNHWTVLAREIEGQYPNWRQCVPSPDSIQTWIRFSEEAVQSLLEIIPRLPGEDILNQPMRLIITPGQLQVCGQDHKGASLTPMTIPGIAMEGLALTLTVNRHFMIKALKLGLHELDITDSRSAMIFHHTGKRLVVMPVRTEDNNQPKEPEPMNTTPNPRITPPIIPEPRTAATTTPHPKDEVVSLKQAMEDLEKIRSSLKDVVNETTELLKILNKVEREKRTTEKEIAVIRSTLREIQAVKI